MSVKCSDFYGEANGEHWHVWHNGMRSTPGVFVDVNASTGREDEWGYSDLEITSWGHETADGILAGAQVRVFLPRAVCEAIAKWVEYERALEARKTADGVVR